MNSLYQTLAAAIDARLSCIAHHQERPHLQEWIGKHQDRIEKLARDYLPSGSGIDCGTTVDLEKSTGENLVLLTEFHHMGNNGFYDGWTQHTVIVTASLIHGLNIKIGGHNRNYIKDYLLGVFDLALRTTLQDRGM